MSTRFSFSIADSSDDDELRKIIGKISMPGPISLVFCREPSFFLAEDAGCIKSETIICKKNDTGEIIGFGGRSLWNVYQDGQKKKIWYLHSLRSLPKERNGIALLQGYKYFHSLQNDSDFKFFLTTIFNGNSYAKKVLEGGRAGMPSYTKINTMITYLISLRVKNKLEEKNIHTMNCDTNILPLAYQCVDEWNQRHDFAPAYSLSDIKNPNKLFPGFSLQNLYIHHSKSVVSGTLGVWDQQSFKQIIVANYTRGIKVLRPFYNVSSFVRRLPPLPKIGEKINMIYTSFLGIKDDDPIVFNSLLNRAVYDWSGCGYDWLALGLCEGSPLEKIVAKKSKRQLVSSIYIVHWGDDSILPVRIANPHLEIAFL